MSKEISCSGCDRYLGVIRDAKLMKDISFLCRECEIKRSALEMKRADLLGSGIPSDVDDLFGGIFKKR